MSGRDWTLHTEATAPQAIYDAINGAKRVINIEYFGIGDAGNGAHITDALEAAARRGVEVNVITDLSSLMSSNPMAYLRFRRRITAAGGTVKSSFALPKVRSLVVPEGLRNVTHRKVATIDGSHAFVGGINFFPQTDDFRDAVLEVHGVTAARAAADQVARWARSGGTVSARNEASVRDALKGAAPVAGPNARLRLIANSPDEHRTEISDTYTRLIRSAKRRLWVTSPVFSDKRYMEELAAAARRGVDVRVLGPGHAQFGIAPLLWMIRGHARDLIDAGASVYGTPELIHMKVIVGDDEAVISSFNLSNRSRTYDQELGIATKDPKLVGALSRLLSEDMSRAEKLERDDTKGVGVEAARFLVHGLGFTY